MWVQVSVYCVHSEKGKRRKRQHWIDGDGIQQWTVESRKTTGLGHTFDIRI